MQEEKLVESDTPDSKEDNTLKAICNQNCGWLYLANQNDFEVIPSTIISGYLATKMIHTFATASSLASFGVAKQGLATADNNRFLRIWFEVNNNNIGFNITNTETAVQSRNKWFPYNKGGEKRRWYGNQDYIVNWENDGLEIKHNIDETGKLRSRPQNTDYYFRPSISWGLLTNKRLLISPFSKGFIYDINGMSFFPKKRPK